MLTVFNRNVAPTRFGYLRPLFREFDDWLASDWRQVRGDLEATPSLVPEWHVDESDDHYTLTFEIPGISREDLNIELTGNRLVVSGERKSEGRDSNRKYGRFERTFTLPEGTAADDISADHKDGVLRLFLKKAAAAKPTKIAIGEPTSEKGGFLKNLLGDKKTKESTEQGGCCEVKGKEASNA